MQTPSGRASTQPSFYRQSPRKNVYKLSQPFGASKVSKDNEPIHNIGGKLALVNRSHVKELEEWTHSTLALLFKQEENRNLDSLERHTLQLQILDQSIQQLADLIKIHCSDQASLLLKLWSSAADVYSVVFKELSKSVDELKVQLADRSLEADNWEEKYRNLKQQCIEEKSNRSYGTEKNNMIRQREEEILVKDKEMLEMQETVTAVSVWFPNFPKFGKSVLSRYLPPLSNADIQEDNNINVNDKTEPAGGSLKLAQGYLYDDLRRLEALGIGLKIACEFENKHGLNQQSLDLFGLPVNPNKSNDGPSLVLSEQYFQNEKTTPISMLNHIQELEAQLLKQQDEFESKAYLLESELHLSQRREKLVRDQLSSIQKQTRSVMHCLPPIMFSSCVHETCTYEVKEPIRVLSISSIFTEIAQFLSHFSKRQSIYSSNSYGSWVFDNISNGMNGQSLYLNNLTPLTLHYDGKYFTSSRLCTLIMHYYSCKCSSSTLALERFNALFYSIIHTTQMEQQDTDKEFLASFVKRLFSIDKFDKSNVLVEHSQWIRDIETSTIVLYWYRTVKSELKGTMTMSLQNVSRCVRRIFQSAQDSSYSEPSVFQKLIEVGDAQFTPCWHYLSKRRQNILIDNIKKDAAPIDTKNPVVSVFTIYHCVHDAVVLFREEMIQKLQELYDFVSSIIVIDPADPVCVNVFLSCLFINPLEVLSVRQEVCDSSEWTSSIQFTHELTLLHLNGKLNRSSFAFVTYEMFSNFPLASLVEFIDCCAPAAEKMESLLDCTVNEISGSSHVGFNNKDMTILRKAGLVFLQVFDRCLQLNPATIASPEIGSRFRKEVREALKLISKRSSFADSVQLQAILRKSCTIENRDFLERLYIHTRLNFDVELQIGLQHSSSMMWFTMASLLGIMPITMVNFVRDSIMDGESLTDLQEGPTIDALMEIQEFLFKDKVAERHYMLNLLNGCFGHWKHLVGHR